MMQLTTSPRAKKETRKAGFIPAVYYGANQVATSVFIDFIEFGKVLKTAGESSSISLVTEHGKENAMIQDVQLDPVKGVPIHADFYIIEKGQKVHVKTPIVFVGESEAVKAGGVLVKVLQELSIEGDPSILPPEFAVDISTLAEVGSTIYVRDIALPSGVELYHLSGDDVIISVAGASEEDLSAPVVADLSTIEVEAKGKKDEEETPVAAE